MLDTPRRLGNSSHQMPLNCRKPVCPQLSFLYRQFQLDLDSIMTTKTVKLQRLSKRLDLMSSHDSIYMLRNVLESPQLMYMVAKVLSFRCMRQYFVSFCLRRSMFIRMTSMLKPGIFAYQVGYSGCPLCCFAGTVYLFGLSRKHHGTHFHLTFCSIPSCQGQRN